MTRSVVSAPESVRSPALFVVSLANKTLAWAITYSWCAPTKTANGSRSSASVIFSPST